MATATNPATGERVYLDEATGQWLPAKTATNPETGAKVFFDGKGWQPLASSAPAQTFPPVTDLDPGGESWEPPVGPVPPTPLADRPATDLSMDEMAGVLNGAPPAFGSVAPGRGAQIAGQGALSGLTSVAMLPLDILVLASKGLNYGVEALAGKAGRTLNNMFETGRFTYNPPTGEGVPIPSEAVKSGASWAAQKLGYEPAVPETFQEKALHNVSELGASGLGGAGILGRLAALRKVAMAEPGALPRFGDKLLRPYMDTPVKAAIADTAGGATAGAALTGAQALPREYRDTGGGAVGTMADLTAMLAGGVSGGTLASATTQTPTAIGNLVRRNLPANIALDPITGLAVSNQTADDVARILAGQTAEPKSLAANIRQSAQGFTDQGLPVPTTDLLAGGELAGIGKRQRTQPPALFEPDTPDAIRQQSSFIERDKALKQAAADEVQSTRQPGVDTELFQSRAAERAQMELEARQRQIDQPTGQAAGVQQAREGEANVLGGNVGATPGASSDLFDVYRNTRALERDRSQALYSRPEFTEHVFDGTALQQTAAEIRANATGAAPVTPRAEAIIQRIETAQEAGTLTGRELSILNKDIESEIKLSLRDGQDFQQLKTLKDGIAQTVTQLPRAHPAREAIDIARANTAERIAPNFREGAGGALDMRLKTNPGQVQPETAGASFLNRGQDAEQLMRIAELRGNTAEVAAGARSILMDRLAQAGVVKNGVIDPDKLTQWRNVRANVIDQIPGLGDEVNGMIRAARGGAERTAQYTDDISAAETRLAQTQKDIKTGPVGKIADKTPEEAVATIMGGSNAAKNMTELRTKMGNNPAANESLKAAVADHFAKKVRAIDTSVTEAEHAVNLRKLVDQFNEHRSTLVAAGFAPEEMQALQRAQTVLMPLLKRNVQATVGSITAENTAAAMRPLEMALKVHYGTLKGGSVFRNVKQGLALVKGDNTQNIEALLTRAMFDPELAATLLTRDVAKAGTPAWNGKLQKLIRRTEVAKDVASGDDE